MKNPILNFITSNSYKLLSETSVQTIFNNCYNSIPNISYKLLSDKPFQIIFTNYYQTLLSTNIWDSFQAILIQTFIRELMKQHLKTYYQRIISNNIQVQNHSKQLITNYYQRYWKQHLQIIIRKWFQIIYIYDNDIYVNTTIFLQYVWPFFNIIWMKRLNSTLKSTTTKINQ